MLKHYSSPLNILFLTNNVILKVRYYGVELWYNYMGFWSQIISRQKYQLRHYAWYGNLDPITYTGLCNWHETSFVSFC